jgi:microcystin-dependent protein
MGPDDYIASIGATAASFAPRNTALCQGQLMPIQQNQALFALIGYIYGGDEQKTFALPDLRGAVPFGAGANPATGVQWELGEEQPTLLREVWLTGLPAKAGAGQLTTAPTVSGATGLALNWAIALYGYWPPRDD